MNRSCGRQDVAAADVLFAGFDGAAVHQVDLAAEDRFQLVLRVREVKEAGSN
jgi:hypothetical protein